MTLSDQHVARNGSLLLLLGHQSRREVLRARFRTMAAMRVQARDQGRHLGGRPPYGYRLVDAGPHPNAAHARWGRRLHRLDPDPATAPYVRWIFALRLARHSNPATNTPAPARYGDGTRKTSGCTPPESRTHPWSATPTSPEHKRSPHRPAIRARGADPEAHYSSAAEAEFLAIGPGAAVRISHPKTIGTGVSHPRPAYTVFQFRMQRHLPRCRAQIDPRPPFEASQPAES
jgi:hypothetical protein